MDCVVCNRTGTAYRLVDEPTEPLAVCEQCVAEHLTDAADGACVYCGTAGGYDLVEDTSAVVASESQAERVVVTPGVVCHDHVGTLRHENT
ncbi:small CPxCG-related zinc finger protein [Halobacterium hubeiense]|uniref:Small CPxCG-related zinc finger protein n=1 Tax=Halobacterium hubeiense TaxID=1407499 RepID=A0A0U5H319_9EURY|nr:hypothetical protein [Halobacterium hubeiense]CQH58595.1 small CPxCG-related zinc finger protein [Halobacterium hubeiense]